MVISSLSPLRGLKTEWGCISGVDTHTSLDAFCNKYPSRVADRLLLYTKDYQQDAPVTCLPHLHDAVPIAFMDAIKFLLPCCVVSAGFAFLLGE